MENRFSTVLRNGLRGISGRACCFGALEGVTATIPFYYPHGTAVSATSEPKKLVLQIDIKDGLLRDTGLKYSVNAPSFRVWLKKDRTK